MIEWKPALLTVYCSGTWPLRAIRQRQAAAAGRMPVFIVFFHRVADDRATPWTVSRSAFARQLDWLSEHCDVVSLAEAQCRIRTGVNHRPAVAITFDDGYADNGQFALPLLVSRQIPCTYFVTLRQVLEQIPFEHDHALGHCFTAHTARELRHWADQGIEIGAHTRSHPNLAALDDPRRLHDEIAVARAELQQLVGQEVRYFAAPFGQPQHFCPELFSVAREAGYAGVCSAYGGYHLPGDRAFHLRRIGLGEHLVTLRNWVTLDPRRQAQNPGDPVQSWADGADAQPSCEVAGSFS